MNVEFAEAEEEVAELSEAISNKSEFGFWGEVLLVDQLVTSHQFDVTNILKVT